MIKILLKQNNVTLSQFASDLKISRPTLDAYIRSYDETCSVPNNVFLKVFDFLFADRNINGEDFAKRYAYVVSYYGGEKTLQELSSEPGLETPEPEPGEIAPTSGRAPAETAALMELCERYARFRSGEPFAELSQREKAAFSSLYRLECRLKVRDYGFDPEAAEEFIAACEQSRRSTEIVQEVKRKIDDVIREELKKKGIDAGDELVESIKKKL